MYGEFWRQWIWSKYFFVYFTKLFCTIQTLFGNYCGPNMFDIQLRTVTKRTWKILKLDRKIRRIFFIQKSGNPVLASTEYWNDTNMCLYRRCWWLMLTVCRRQQLYSAESDENSSLSPDFVRRRLDQLAQTESVSSHLPHWWMLWRCRLGNCNRKGVQPVKIPYHSIVKGFLRRQVKAVLNRWAPANTD